jgi:hypothetical protein
MLVSIAALGGLLAFDYYINLSRYLKQTSLNLDRLELSGVNDYLRKS